MATPPRPEFTVDPPRRTFGSLPKSLHSPTGVGPTTSSPNGSPTPTRTTFLIPPAEPQRTRSASSTSSEAIETAATKAQAWLQGWAPKGEGRGRDFLTNTLSGVAGVASTVGHGINGAVTNIGSQLAENGRERVGMGSRPSSYTSPTSSTPVDGMPTLSRTGSSSPPIPTYSVSTPHLPLANPSPVPLVPSPSKRIVQPSNLSRLGSSTSTTMTSPTFPSPNRPSISHPTSTTSLPPNIPRSSSTSATTVLAQPHGLSHLNPHNRSSSHSHAQFPSSQSRQPSYGARSPTISRSSSVTAGGPSLPSRSPGMPYKIGFQPAGVRNDRTGEFTEDRRKHGEEREKEEGRLGRRWAKVRSRLSSSHR